MNIDMTIKQSAIQHSQAILVAGMHRSGTSAMTKLLSLLGAKLSRNLLGPRPNDNDMGFFESTDILDIHERMLDSLDTSWDDYFAVPESWFKSNAARMFQDEMVGLLHRDFEGAPLWAVKDPRICRFLPFWLDVVEKYGADPHVVIPIRNPLDVAKSLKARNDMPYGKSFLFWLRHVLDAERDSRGVSRSFVTYEALMQDWMGVADKISKDLKIHWPMKTVQVITEANEFLKPSLWRNRSETGQFEARSDAVWWVKQTYALLLDNPEDNYDRLVQELNDIRQQLETATLAFGPEIVFYRSAWNEERSKAELNSMELKGKEEEIQRKDAELAEREAGIDHLNGEISAREGQIQDLSAELAARDERINQLTREIAFRDSQIQCQSGDMKSVEPSRILFSALSDLKIDSLDAETGTALANMLITFEEKICSHDKYLKNMDDRLADLARSKSYRIGKAVHYFAVLFLRTLPSDIKKYWSRKYANGTKYGKKT